MSSFKFTQIDEEGYFLNDGIRTTDSSLGNHLLQQLYRTDKGRFETECQGGTLVVEPFDEPYVALQVHRSDEGWKVQMPYEFYQKFELSSLTLDDWDRFHGTCENGVSFVMSRSAQSEFFNLLDEFDDDSITSEGHQYPTSTWLKDHPDIHAAPFWDSIYINETPRWELNNPSPVLVDTLPQLKLPPSRIIVLGAGSGNDGAFLAKQGHKVTVVDISPEAISRAQEKFGDLENLKIVEADLFSLPVNWHGQFDLVLEHTCYCAVNPSRRNEMVKVWRQLLAEGGHLLGIFYVVPKTSGPPFGATEWTIRERLKKSFRFLYWQRCRNSLERRMGRELLVYGQKI